MRIEVFSWGIAPDDMDLEGCLEQGLMPREYFICKGCGYFPIKIAEYITDIPSPFGRPYSRMGYATCPRCGKEDEF